MGINCREIIFECLAKEVGHPIANDLNLRLVEDLGIDSLGALNVILCVEDQINKSTKADAATITSLKTVGNLVSFVEKF